MKIKKPNPFGSLSSKRLEEFERTACVRLPDDYRRFLLDTNGGEPWPANTIDFKERGRPTSTDVQFLYGIHNSEEWASLEWHVECFSGRIVADGLPIGGDSGGNQFVLMVRGERTGQIWFWDHERETEPPGYSNMSYVASSFTRFCEKLYEYVDPHEKEADRIIRLNDVHGLKALLSGGYDIEQTDEYDRTLMENAAIHNRPELIQILFEHGAQLRNALEYARKNYQFFEEHRISVELLERLGSYESGLGR